MTGFDGAPLSRPALRVAWDAVSAEKGGYAHFMAKEIAEQPTVVIETIGHKLSLETGLFNESEMGVPKALLKEIDRVQIVACGTSWHAGLVAKFLLEEIARMRTDVDYASEFRYRAPLVDGRTLVLGISQSGETADTVAALKEAKALGGRTVGVVNVPGSAIARLVDGVLATHAGPEVGVASTKAFTTQLVALVLFALYVRSVRSGGETPVDAGLPGGPRAAARGPARDAGARARDREALGAVREGLPRPLPRARRALPDRARGRAQAQGDLVHPRRGLSRPAR